MSVIKSVELDLGGRIVKLTPKQARNLKEALDELFGKEIVREKEYVPYYPLRPNYWEYDPYRFVWSGSSLYSFDTDSCTLSLTA